MCRKGLTYRSRGAKTMEKAKGMLQMLWESGFIDETKLQHYTVDGKKDAYEVLILNTILKYMVLNLTIF
jgi:hypothetical protein